VGVEGGVWRTDEEGPGCTAPPFCCGAAAPPALGPEPDPATERRVKAGAPPAPAPDPAPDAPTSIEASPALRPDADADVELPRRTPCETTAASSRPPFDPFDLLLCPDAVAATKPRLEPPETEVEAAEEPGTARMTGSADPLKDVPSSDPTRGSADWVLPCLGLLMSAMLRIVEAGEAGVAKTGRPFAAAV
jgi:hypothetical protein